MVRVRPGESGSKANLNFRWDFIYSIPDRLSIEPLTSTSPPALIKPIRRPSFTIVAIIKPSYFSIRGFLHSTGETQVPESLLPNLENNIESYCIGKTVSVIYCTFVKEGA